MTILKPFKQEFIKGAADIQHLIMQLQQITLGTHIHVYLAQNIWPLQQTEAHTYIRAQQITEARTCIWQRTSALNRQRHIHISGLNRSQRHIHISGLNRSQGHVHISGLNRSQRYVHISGREHLASTDHRDTYIYLASTDHRGTYIYLASQSTYIWPQQITEARTYIWQRTSGRTAAFSESQLGIREDMS